MFISRSVYEIDFVFISISNSYQYYKTHCTLGGGGQNNCTKFCHSAWFVPNGLVSQIEEMRDVV
jgi:hypothetical protein